MATTRGEKMLRDENNSMIQMTFLAALAPKKKNDDVDLLYLATFNNRKAKVVNCIQNSGQILQQS